jgi:hypothetical protein
VITTDGSGLTDGLLERLHQLRVKFNFVVREEDGPPHRRSPGVVRAGPLRCPTPLRPADSVGFLFT